MPNGAKYHVFTINNPEAEPEAFCSKLESIPDIEYAVFQKEEGESGTPHFQGIEHSYELSQL